jgi:hypothetical protein
MTAPHSTDNYTIGKAVVYVGEWNGTTPPTDPAGYSDMGNCSSAEIEPSVERQPHYSSRSGFRVKDKNPVIESNYTVNLVLDEIAAVNLKKFLLGSVTGRTVHILTQPNKEFALKIVEDNPTGPNKTWKFWRGTLAPNGPMQLIGDDYVTMSYTFEGLSDVAHHASSPYGDAVYETTTSTSTTTTS